MPVVGRVTMDMIMVSLGESGEGKQGEEVVIYGQQRELRYPLMKLLKCSTRLTMKWCLH